MKTEIRTNLVNDIVGPRLTLELPGETSLRRLIEVMVQSYGKRVRERLFTGGKLKPSVTILVNGHVWPSVDLDTPLPDYCKISIFRILAGG